jgi:hypothetical protein
MDCNLCSDLSSPPAAEGPCSIHSHLYVCTRGRPDNIVHGERCGCHCENLFCLTHARAHLIAISGGTMAECFPALSMSLSGPVLAASVGLTLRRADSGGTDYSSHGSDKNGSRRAIALFLTYATPGINALAAATLDDTGIANLELIIDELWRAPRLNVPDTFLTSGRMSKIMGIAVRQIAEVWRRRPGLVHRFAADVRSASQLPSDAKSLFIDTLCYALLQQENFPDAPFEVLAAHVEAMRLLSRNPRASEETVDPLIVSAIYHATRAPRSEPELAQWLIAPDEMGQTSAYADFGVVVT